MTDQVARGMAAGALVADSALALLQRERWIPRGLNSPARVVMASPPTVTSSASATLSGQTIYAAYQLGGAHLGANGQRFSYYRANQFTAISKRIYGTHSHLDANTARGKMSVGFYHDGQNIEIIIPGQASGGTGGGSYPLFKVDDEYVTLTPQSLVADGNDYYFKLAFADRARRRIDVIGITYFGGVVVEANDSVDAAPIRGPKVIIVGDSISGGAAGNYADADSWPAIFADAMGWDDVISSSIGSTGYTTPGLYSFTARDRFTYDVSPYAPDIVIFADGRNDTGASGTVGAETLALFQQCANALPKALRIVTSPIWISGPFGWNSTLVATRDAIKASALATGCLFIDTIERPFARGYSGMSSVTGSGISIGATTFVMPANTDPVLPVPSTAVVGGERVYIKSGSGTLYTIDGAFAAAHAAGVAVTQVGDCLFTGHGSTGAPTGFGNCDLFTYTDLVHPNSLGHYPLGMEIAGQVYSQLSQMRI